MKKLFIIIDYGTIEVNANSFSDVYNLVLDKNEEIEKYRINLICNNNEINENNFGELDDESTIIIQILGSCCCWFCDKNIQVKFFNLNNKFVCLFCIKKNKSKHINNYREIIKKDIEKLCLFHNYEKDLICFDCVCFYCFRCKNHENHKRKSINDIKIDVNEKKVYLNIIKRNFNSFAQKNDIDKIINNKFDGTANECIIILKQMEFILNDPPKMHFDKRSELKKIERNLRYNNGHNLKQILSCIYDIDKLKDKYFSKNWLFNSFLITLVMCDLIDNNYEYKNLLKKIENEQDKLKNYYTESKHLNIYHIELSREVDEMKKTLEEYHNKGYFY